MSWFGKGKAVDPLDVDSIKDKTTFLAFMKALRAGLHDQPEGWENPELPAFLEAMEAWTTDSRFDRSANPWRHAAELLRAARDYE